jgi:hypothetical protein
MKATCEKCGKSFSKKTKASAMAALKMHIGRKHGNIRTATAEEFARRANADVTFVTTPEKAKGDGSSAIVSPEAEKRRAYQRLWRQRKFQKLKVLPEPEASMPVHFCPRCGLNLQTFATALAVVSRT